MRVSAIAGLALLGAALATPAAAQRDGVYALSGTNPDGSGYSGQVVLGQVGLSSWRVLWQIGENRIEGFGMSSGATFAVGFTLGNRPGLGVYTVGADGSISGQWTIVGSSALGTEILTPRP